MAKRYRVTLTQEEREQLRQMISRGKADARKLAHARILLQADESEGGPRRTDEQIASASSPNVMSGLSRINPRSRSKSCSSSLRVSGRRGGSGASDPVVRRRAIRSRTHDSLQPNCSATSMDEPHSS